MLRERLNGEPHLPALFLHGNPLSAMQAAQRKYQESQVQAKPCLELLDLIVSCRAYGAIDSRDLIFALTGSPKSPMTLEN